MPSDPQVQPEKAATDELEREDSHRLYQNICNNIDREDRLVGQRLGNLLIVSGGIFAAFGLICAGIANLSLGTELAEQLASGGLFFLIFGLSIVAIWLTDATKNGIEAAQDQLDYLKDYYFKNKPAFDKRGWPRPFGNRGAFSRGSAAAIIFPRLLWGVWSLAALISFACFVLSLYAAFSNYI